MAEENQHQEETQAKARPDPIETGKTLHKALDLQTQILTKLAARHGISPVDEPQLTELADAVREIGVAILAESSAQADPPPAT